MARDPGVHRPPGVVDPGHPLEHERAAPLVPQPGDVLPAGRRGLHPLPVGAEERGRRSDPAAARLGVVRSGTFRVRAKSRSQLRPGAGPRGRSGSIVLRSIFSGMEGLPQSRPWENDQSRVAISPTAPAARARSMRSSDRLSRPDPVHLEERLGVGRHHLLDRLAGEGAQPHRRPPRGRGPGHGHLAVGVHGLDARGRDDHRQRDLLAHHRGGQVALRGQAGDVGGEAQLGEGGDVVLDGEPLLRAGDQRPVDRLGQPLLGPALRFGHGFEPTTAHRSPSCDRTSALNVIGVAGSAGRGLRTPPP